MCITLLCTFLCMNLVDKLIFGPTFITSLIFSLHILHAGGLEVFSCYIAEDYFISKAIFNRLVHYPVCSN